MDAESGRKYFTLDAVVVTAAHVLVLGALGRLHMSTFPGSEMRQTNSQSLGNPHSLALFYSNSFALCSISSLCYKKSQVILLFKLFPIYCLTITTREPLRSEEYELPEWVSRGRGTKNEKAGYFFEVSCFI